METELTESKVNAPATLVASAGRHHNLPGSGTVRRTFNIHGHHSDYHSLLFIMETYKTSNTQATKLEEDVVMSTKSTRFN